MGADKKTLLYCCDFHARTGDGWEPCVNHQPELCAFFELLAKGDR